MPICIDFATWKAFGMRFANDSFGKEDREFKSRKKTCQTGPNVSEGFPIDVIEKANDLQKFNGYHLKGDASRRI